MINSIINGNKIYNEKNTMISKDISGNNLDEVHIFDEEIKKYIPDLLDSLNIWKKTSINKRLDSIRSIKSTLEDNFFANKLIESICKEIGKPLCEAETEISESIALIDFFLDNVNDELFISNIEVDPYYESKKNYIKLSPIGIVGIIKPWNYPITNSLWSILPAIISGNIVIYKPSEYCCHTANILAEAFMQSNLPKGVFNVLFGGSEVGTRIVECKEVSMISFTGSSEAAIEIQKKSADLGIIRKYSLETGGSDSAIIDKNVDIEFAVNGILWGAFNNAGQVCTSIENVFIPTEIYVDFVSLLKKQLSKLCPGKDYGKIQNHSLKIKIEKILSRVNKNALTEVVSGGYIENNYLIPTLIECKDYQEINYEVFSNILRIFKYENLSDIPKIINSSIYGLGCSIWTSEPESLKIKDIIDEIDVGMIWINDVNVAFPEMPWTGVKNSGVGFNLSLDSIKEFSTIKSISIDSNSKTSKEWWFPYEA